MLVEERIIVKQLEEDLYDGQVLQKLLGESTAGTTLSHPHLPVAALGWARILCVVTWSTGPRRTPEAAVCPSQVVPSGPGLWLQGPLSPRRFYRTPSHGAAAGWGQLPELPAAPILLGLRPTLCPCYPLSS